MMDDSIKAFLRQTSDEDVDKDISGLIQCSICLRTMDDPRALPCLHSFCFSCLKRLAAASNPDVAPDTLQQISCPMCKKDFTISPTGLESLLVSNFYITTLKDRRSRQEKLIPCTSCNDYTMVAVARCLECKDFLCDKCFVAHKTERLLKSHQTCTLKELRSGGLRGGKFSAKPEEQFCEVHKGQRLHLFCTTCAVPICEICTKETHPSKSHSHADLISSTKKRQEKIMDLADKCQQLMKEVDTSIEQVVKTKQVIKESVEKAAGDINQSYQLVKAELLVQLGKRRQHLETLLKTDADEKGKEVDKHLQDLIYHQARLKNALSMVKQITNTSSHYATAELFATLTETLQELAELKPASLSSDSTEVKFMPYSISVDALSVPCLGYFTPRMVGQEFDAWVLHKQLPVAGSDQLRGVAVNPNGDIAVADIGKNQVYVCEPSGDLKVRLLHPSPSESHGIAVSTDGCYFVTGLGQNVDVFNDVGAFQYKFAAVSPSNMPSDQEETSLIGITVDSTTQHLLVADINKKYISKHQLNGTHISSISVGLEPWYILVTGQSTIVASSYTDHAVHMISQDGHLLHKFSIPMGLAEHQWCPTGICLAQDIIFVNNFSSEYSGVYCFCAVTREYLGVATDDVKWPTGIAVMEDGGLKLLVVQGSWDSRGSGIKIFTQQ